MVLVYGAYGYSGKLILYELLRLGIKPTIAGRNEEKLAELSSQTKLPFKCFELKDFDTVSDALSNFQLLLNCAGPFSQTAEILVNACLEKGISYFDITGEIAVFEKLYARDMEAKSANSTVVAGVGFDVVPTDCLALGLKQKYKNSIKLELAFGSGGGISRGTLNSIIEKAGTGSLERYKSKLHEVPFMHKIKTFNIKEKSYTCVSIPWGDLSSAYRSTGIQNIVTYCSIPDRLVKPLSILVKATKPLKYSLVVKLLKALVDKFVEGPNYEKLQKSSGWVYAEVTTDEDKRFYKVIKLDNPYLFTARSAALCTKLFLEDRSQIPHGALTPAQAFGLKLLELLNLEIIDEGEL